MLPYLCGYAATGVRMSAPATGRQIGARFNPWKRFNGVFVPLGLLAYPGLSDGAKLLYGRLCMYAGKQGICYAWRDTIAEDMGIHVGTVARQLNELTEAGFIRRVQRGRGRPAACEFLYHPALIGSERSGEAIAEMRQQNENQQSPGVAKMDLCCRENATQQSQKCDSTYKEDKIHLKDSLKDSSSSSREGSGNSKRGGEPAAGKKKIPLSSKSRKPETPERAWYEDDGVMEQAAAMIGKSVEYRGFSMLPQLEVHTVMAILQNMTGLEDLQLWLDLARTFHSSAKTWGRVVTDAKHWPKRRGMTETIVARAVPVPVAETSGDFFREEPTPAAEAQPVRSAPTPTPCVECAGTGIRQAAHDEGLWEACECPAGMQAETPSAVEKANAAVIKLRRFRAPMENTAEVPAPRARGSGSIDRKGLVRAGDVIPALAVEA
jgi:hypothetical protein